MFQLILGISLGVILLFVIVLLITEVAATYPVWKHFDSSFLTALNKQVFKSKIERSNPGLFLLVLASMLALCLVALLMMGASPQEEKATVLPAERAEDPEKVYTKPLSDSSAEFGLSFTLQTKWEGGKMYGNNKVSFYRNPVWSFSEWRYFFLDKEDYLIKELSFTPNSFVFETAAGGRITGLVNKFNTDLNFSEFQKIEKLKVVLNRKLPVE